MTNQSQLVEILPQLLGDSLIGCEVTLDEVTCWVKAQDIVDVGTLLRDDAATRFDQLIDLCAVDYSTYGEEAGYNHDGPRYTVVYHLLSLPNNLRLRVKADLSESNLSIQSVIQVWAGADWFEREAFDLFGIIFVGHPDLRRLLTDYGFIGHPFRKDFPLSGKVEMRYDANQGRVIYQPVTIEPRILVPRTIRTEVGSNRLRAGPPVKEDIPTKGNDGAQ